MEEIKYIKGLFDLTTMHRQISCEQAEQCRELIEELFPEENDCKSQENHIE